MKAGLLCIFLSIITLVASSQTRVKTISASSTATLVAEGGDATKFQWLRNGAPIAAATDRTLIVSQAGVYTVLTYNDSNCSSEQSDPVEIVVTAAPPVKVDLAITKTSTPGPAQLQTAFEYKLVAVNNGPGAAKNVRITDSLPQSLSMEDCVNCIKTTVGTAFYSSEPHQIEWTIPVLENGQSAELTFTTKATVLGMLRNTAGITSDNPDSVLRNNFAADVKDIRLIGIPNAITPNGDGRNDAFRISGIEALENEIEIINRWGDKVFARKDYKNDWSGDGLNEGTYFYTLRIKSSTGSWQAYKGYITLMRQAIQE